MDRKQIVQELKSHHKELTDKDLYLPKCIWTPWRETTRLQLFKSELEQECDIYTEAISKENVPEDIERKLYVLKYNPNWREEYEQKINAKDLYIIPFAKLELVVPKPNPLQQSQAQTKTNLQFDLPEYKGTKTDKVKPKVFNPTKPEVLQFMGWLNKFFAEFEEPE